MNQRDAEKLNLGLKVEVWSPKLTQKQIDSINSPFQLAIVPDEDVIKDIKRMCELDSQEFGLIYGLDYSTALGYLVYNLKSVTCVVRDEKTQVIEGFTIAIPARDAYAGSRNYVGRGTEDDVAYIVTTVISPEHRGQGIVGILMRQLEKELKSKGFNFIDRDANDERKADGESYADKVVRNSGDRISINQIIQDTPVGPQRYIRMSI